MLVSFSLWFGGCGNNSNSGSDGDTDTDTDTDNDTDADSDTDTENDDHFAFGVSSYGSVRQWAIDANEIHGADFKYLYIYILAGGMENTEDFEDWYIVPFIDDTESIGATPLLTFYQLLHLGEAHDHAGSEAEIVEGCMEDSGCMNNYFENYIWFLQVVDEHSPQAIVHVEPDSWGFMMWAMGVEGNDDSSSVTVQVDGSGHPDAAGFDDTAAGLGQAMVALRDQYAPDALLAWHASNFRVGNSPEVVTGFFSDMGEWDLLAGEHMHNQTDETEWWAPWEPELVERNLEWVSTITKAAGLPLILWQLPIGTDYQLIGDGPDYQYISQLSEAGVIAALFHHNNENGVEDPDDYSGFPDPPPEGSDAGGTAAHMRERVVTYNQSF